MKNTHHWSRQSWLTNCQLYNEATVSRLWIIKISWTRCEACFKGVLKSSYLCLKDVTSFARKSLWTTCLVWEVPHGNPTSSLQLLINLQSSLYLVPCHFLFILFQLTDTAATNWDLSSTNMADFDAIYEDQDENSSILEAPNISMTPEPVVIRGAGNITV